MHFGQLLSSKVYLKVWYTFTLKYVIKIVYEDYTVLMLKHLSGDFFQVLAVCLLSTLFSIAIPAKYKVTESTTYS